MQKYKKRVDGRYRVELTVGRRDDGRPIKKMVYGRTIPELESKLAEIRGQRDKGTLVIDNKTTLGEWATEWLATYQKGKRSNTYDMYRRCVELYIVPSSVAKVPITKVKQSQLQKLINDKLQEGHTRAADMLRLTLKQIMKKAMGELIHVNPAADLPLIKYESAPQRPMTDEENVALEKAELKDKHRAFMYLLKYAGLRRGEALAMSKADINLKKREISVNKEVIFKGPKGELIPYPKTSAGFRDVPMCDKLFEFMAKYLSTMENLALFLTEDGKVCTRICFRRMWETIMRQLNKAAGAKDNLKLITDLHPHILRHDYATNLYYAGVDIKTAQYLLGHKKIEMTLNIYTHLAKKSKVTKENVADKMNHFLADGQKTVSVNDDCNNK